MTLGQGHDAWGNIYFNTKKEDSRLHQLEAQIAKLKTTHTKMEYELSRLHGEIHLLRENEALFSALVEQAPDALFAHDLQGRFVFVNDVACQALGYTREELLTMDVQQVGHGWNPEQVEAFWKEVTAGKTVHAEGMLQRKDGTLLPVDIRIGLFDAMGKMLIYGIARDISERVMYEERLRQAHKMEAVGTLAGGVAHDFNNILGIILGCAELAGDPLDKDHPSHEYLKEIRLSVLRAKEVVRQLLNFSQKSDEVQKPMRIAPLIKQSLKLLRSTIPTNIEFQSMIADNDYHVMANPTQIHQVMINLFANAAYATREGGTIDVMLQNSTLAETGEERDIQRGQERCLQLTVRDNGCGILPEHLERIFEPYFTTKDVGKGSGMGLAVVHGIVKSHGGVIQLSSTPDQGTAIDVFFPAVDPPDHENQLDGAEVEELPGGSETILVVDDETIILNGIRAHLERMGYRVEGFNAPLDALDRLRAAPHHFDLLITDMAMPKLTGDVLVSKCQAIRPQLPAILCTGFSEHLEGKTPEELGVSMVLLKPIDRKALATAVRHALEAKRNPKILGKV